MLCRPKSKGSPRSSRKAVPPTGSSTGVQVGALDERNLKRAVHRYGTLPKGARIGAYLESLRVAGGQPDVVEETTSAAGGSCHDMTSAGDCNVPAAAAARQLSKGTPGTQQPMLRYYPVFHLRFTQKVYGEYPLINMAYFVVYYYLKIFELELKFILVTFYCTTSSSSRC